MTNTIRFPAMRLQVASALQSLGDPQHQRAQWGRAEEGADYYDDLTLNIHILYDDCMVSPEPQKAVPNVLHAEEIMFFLDLEKHLGRLIYELGDANDETYTSDLRWSAVVNASRRPLIAMQHLDNTPQEG